METKTLEKHFVETNAHFQYIYFYSTIKGHLACSVPRMANAQLVRVGKIEI